MSFRLLACGLILAVSSVSASGGDAQALPGSRPLTAEGDLSVKMMAGLRDFLQRTTKESVGARASHWRRDPTSAEAYVNSVEPNRQRLRTVLGVVDERLPARMERFGDEANPALVAETDRVRIDQVRWPVLEGVWGEGLWLRPKAGKPSACVIALGDADETPEQIAGLASPVQIDSPFARRLGREQRATLPFALRLAESGCEVIVPVLINRDDRFWGNPKLVLGRRGQPPAPNQSHREWLYRQAYEMGRHLIGYEVQKVLAVVDWLKNRRGSGTRVGVAGHGEGGLIAFYAAALDTRIDSALVSGYFGPREGLWQEPPYRNVWRLLTECGDAEIAGLIAPRKLIIEHSPFPRIEVPNTGNRSLTPSRLETLPLESVQREVHRARAFIGKLAPEFISAVHGKPGIANGTVAAISAEALSEFLRGGPGGGEVAAYPADAAPLLRDRRQDFDPDARQRRQILQIQRHIQELLRYSHQVRDQLVLNRLREKGSVEEIAAAAKPLKEILWNEVMGRVRDPLLPLNPRTRKIIEADKYTGYEVVLDVWPESFAWGVLLVPNDMKDGERRPVVVCQHGGGGTPFSVIDEKNRTYGGFAAKLAERGFITYATHNPHNGRHRFGPLSRLAGPLGLSLWSLILAHHQQHLRWLESLPFVDRERIAFYGLSYGGKTAMRVPALLDGYCLSVCSGDFNEWIRKNVAVDMPQSYVFTAEYDMPEFNLGHTFNYAEMAYLIFPRPFMVERGHNDGVASDEWVAFEYAKVRRFYDQAGVGDRTEIEFFEGVHQIHGRGTFEFLDRHLNRPRRPGTDKHNPPRR